MRIGLMISGSLDTLTGGFLYDRFLVEALEGRGHRVEVVRLSAGPYAMRLRDNGSKAVLNCSSRNDWDLVLQDELCHPSLLRLNRHMMRRGRVPVVAIVHQVLCRQPRSRLLNAVYETAERAYLQSVNGLIFNSETSRDQVIGRLQPRPVPHCVATPGGDRLGRLGDAGRVAERSRAPGPLRLLFVGNLSRIKGLLPLIESLGRMPPTMWRLTVAGSPPAGRRLPRAIGKAAAGAVPQIRFLGALDGAPLREVYAQSHVFTMPYAHEAFGIAALEAMAFSLPVIGSTAGALRALVRPGENGFLVAPGDRDSLGGHLRRLHHDRTRLLEMSQAAYAAFLERPTWAESMARACDFLEETARSPRTGCARS
jgi:glycosyltransferase involved in cell wall biosynthesis